MACPNYNSPEWKTLEASLGGSRVDALAVFSFENYNRETDLIPSPERAQQILKQLYQLDGDERHVRQSEAYKLGKIKQEADERLTPLLSEASSLTPGQRQAVEKILAGNQAYQQLLAANLERFESGGLFNQTISVSAFIGSSDYTGDMSAGEDFRLLGTYLHNLLEDAQHEANRLGKSSAEVLTRSYFDAHRAKLKGKEQFAIENLGEDQLFEIGRGMAGLLEKDSKSRTLILPEITVTSQDIYGRTIVGRIDLLLLDTDGNAKIFDFKTKKVSNLLDAEGHLQLEQVRAGLASKRYLIDTGAGSNFQQEKRGVYDTWTLQTKTYENMLWKLGLSVSGSEIVSMLYQAGESKKGEQPKFAGYALEVFQGTNYYLTTGAGQKVRDVNQKLLTPEQSQARVRDFRARVDEMLPLSEAQAKTSEANFIRHFAFDMSEQEQQRLSEQLGERIKADLARARTGLRTHPKGSPLHAVYDQRLTTLKAFQDILDKGESLGQSLKLKFTCEALEAEFTKLSAEAQRSFADFRRLGEGLSEEHRRANETLRQLRARLTELEPVFHLVETLVSQAISSEAYPDITADSPIARLLADLRANAADITEKFRESALEQFVTVVQTQVGEKGFERVSQQYLLAIEPQIAHYEADIEKLKAGLSPSLTTRLGANFFTLASKILPFELTRDLDAVAKSQLSKIEELKLKIEQLRLIHQTGFSYKREDIKRWIQGVSNPASTFYVGQSDAYSTGFITRLDGFMAGISNSDQALYSLVSYLKQAEADARINAQAEFQTQDFDQSLRALVDEKGEKGANESLTEERTVERVVRNKAGELERVSSSQRYFLKPTSAAYDQHIQNYHNQNRELRHELDLAEKKVHSFENGSPEFQAARAEVGRLIRARTELRQTHRDWQAQHQHLPMVAEYYQLLARLDPQTEEKVNDLYFLIEELQKKNGGKNSEELFDEDDLHLIHEYEIQIRKLRQQASEKNPLSQELLDKLDDFFDYDTNWVAFNRTKLGKERAYADNPEALSKWREENMVYAPTKAWHEELSSLWQQLGELAGELDPKLQALLQQRTQILRAYKRDGELNPEYLSDADVELLRQADLQLAEYRKLLKSREDSRSAELREQTSGILARIGQLRGKRVNAYYQRALDERTRQLLQSRQNLLDAQEKMRKARVSGEAALLEQAREDETNASNAYYTQEQAYRVWFNRNHVNKLLANFLKTGASPKGYAKPKSFNYEDRPPKELEAEYMEWRPRGKWNQRTIREAALNPDYEKHFRLPDGTPLPKSLRIDNGVVSQLAGTDAQYVNPAYQQLQLDPKAKAFYDKLLPYYFRRQDSITGRAPGYLVPGGESNFVQEAHSSSLGEALKRGAQVFLDKHATGTESETDKATNFYGDAGDRVRLRFGEQLSGKLQSSDSINNVVQWLAESHYNEQLSQAQPVVDSMLDYLRLELDRLPTSAPGYTKRAADLTQLLKLMQFERDKFVAGKSSDGDNRATRKILGSVFGYTAFARIAFDVANQTKNYLSGSLQSWMAAGGDSTSLHYNRADMGWAMSQQFGREGFFADYLRDWGKLSGLSKNTQLYRQFDPGQYGLDKALHDTTGARNRRLLSKLASPVELSHALQEKGDMMISQATWLAVMKHYQFQQLDEQGNPVVLRRYEDGTEDYQLVSALDCYALNSQNQLVIRSDVKYSKADENFLREVVHSEVRKAQGNYATSDKTQIESTLIGQIMNFFRKYLVPNVLTRLGHLRPNWEGKDLHYGYLRAIGAAFQYYGGVETAKHLLLGGYTPQYLKNSKINAFYSEKLGHASRDFLSAAVLSVIAMMLMAYVRRKKEANEEIGFFAGNVIRVLWGVKQETVSMNPMPLIGGADDYIKNFTSFTTMTRELTMVPKILTHLLATMYASTVGGWGEEPQDDGVLDDLYHAAYVGAYYQRAEGAYEAGDFKLGKDVADLTGVKNLRNFFVPQYGVDSAKKYQ